MALVSVLAATPAVRALPGPREPSSAPAPAAGALPNIVLAIADDWSWPHAGAYGDPVVSTPGFDRVAAEGVLFASAFASAPSCTTSRAAILTGQHPWRLAELADLYGTFPARFAVYTDLLVAAGYHVGHVGKSWGPGLLGPGGRTSDPCGPEYAGVDAFLEARPPGAPFCLWFGPEYPHRPYVAGSGLEAGLDPDAVVVPGCLPDDPLVRSDLLDYYLEVQVFDGMASDLLDTLQALGELDDTLFVYTSDNGLPFPRCKANLYDQGTRVPLAVRWPALVPGGRTVEDLVDLSDLMPTFLEAAGLGVPAEVTARSLLPVLTSGASGQVDPTRDRVFLARERHTPAQPCTTASYPMRALRTADFLLIENLEPRRWPAGGDDASTAYRGLAFADVDEGPSKAFLVEGATNPALAPFHALAFAKRPRLELYDLAADPEQLVDVASDPERAATLEALRAELDLVRATTGDPRSGGGGAAFDAYPYYGPVSPPPLTLGADVVPASGDGAAFLLDAGPAFAGASFVLLASGAGSAPGTTLGSVLLPLNPDPLFQAVLGGLALFSGSPGTLDRFGRASASLALPPAFVLGGASSYGTRLDVAFLLLDGTTALLASNPCALRSAPVGAAATAR